MTRKSRKKKARRAPAKDRRTRQRPAPADVEILDVQGAAKALGFSPKYIRHLAHAAKLPGTKFGNTWRFLRSDLRNTIAGAGLIGSPERIRTGRGFEIRGKRK